MSKQKKKTSTPNLPPETLLRIRLDGLWQNPGLAGQSAEQIESDLSAVTRGHKPVLVVITILHAFQAASPGARERLETVLPGWLARSGHATALEATVTGGSLSPEHQPHALRWLSASGRNVSPPSRAEADMFHSAYRVGDESQAALNALWYTNPQKTRARGMQFLIDYNPPWDGSVKDAFLFANKPPEALIRRYVTSWEERGNPMTPIGAGEAKRELLAALNCNRIAKIRLPRDLVLIREQFFQHILTLPDAPGTPPFTVEDFHQLNQTGQSAEEIAHFEQTVARRVRMADGKELYIDASLANQDFDDFDDDR